LASRWGLQRPFIKSHAEKSGRGHGTGKLPKILESLFNIFATAEASDFKFGMQLEFAKCHHKIPHRRKEGRGPKLGKLSKLGVFP